METTREREERKEDEIVDPEVRKRKKGNLSTDPCLAPILNIILLHQYRELLNHASQGYAAQPDQNKCPNVHRPQCPPSYTIPMTTLALKLPPRGIPVVYPSTPSSKLPSRSSSTFDPDRYSSDRRADDFQPHDWERVNESGAEANLSKAVPSADAQVIEKYALSSALE
jgi:hypothetical protein